MRDLRILRVGQKLNKYEREDADVWSDIGELSSKREEWLDEDQGVNSQA